MGIEYTLRFDHSDMALVADAVRNLPSCLERVPPYNGFELRTGGSSTGMPDAFMQVEPYGVYFCDNGGAGREFLGVVVASLVSHFGTVTIAELE
jgi:hypothetical protein